ncbi:MAG: MBL fold metallo-hydrolase, partial [Alphaproteobacteria bacterium]|nr:MBL fold metallo-hydrolase [Alphaproteobacteria bacterium]
TPLNHPNRATGYRVEYGGKSICYVTDTEHVPGRLDRNVLGLIEGADIAVYDSMYDDARLGGHTGWGHSTWEEALRLADAAKVKTMVLYHHDPDNDDDTLDAMAREAGRRRPGTVVAREGMMLAP